MVSSLGSKRFIVKQHKCFLSVLQPAATSRAETRRCLLSLNTTTTTTTESVAALSTRSHTFWVPPVNMKGLNNSKTHGLERLGQQIQRLGVRNVSYDSTSTKEGHISSTHTVSKKAPVNDNMGATASRTISVEAPETLSDIAFRIVDQSRYPEILHLLYKNFHTDEPMSKTVGMLDGTTSVPVLDEFALNALGQNLSIMAIDPMTDHLLGVAINVEAKKEDENVPLKELLDKYKHPRFRHILTVLYRVNEKAGDIFANMETDIFFDIKMVTTDKTKRRGGLATDLLRRSVELARNLGFKAVKTEATGLFSRKAFERLGFSVQSEYLYEDYVSDEGEKVFAALADYHRCTTLMTKRLFPKQSSIDEVKNE